MCLVNTVMVWHAMVCDQSEDLGCVIICVMVCDLSAGLVCVTGKVSDGVLVV